jgi:PAS domain S-box-containing protein
MAPVFGEDVFRTIVEQSLDAVAFIKDDGKVAYASSPLMRVLGYSPEEFIEYDAFELFHPNDRQLALEQFAKIKEQPGLPQTSINRVLHKNGSWRWIETGWNNQLHAPTIGAIIATFRDVTEQKQVAQSVRAVEEKFRGIVESATEFAIFTTDFEGVVNSWNSGATRLLGYEESEVIGKHCRILFTPEDNVTHQPEAEMRDALVKGSGNDERWHLKKNGERFWGSGLMMPLQDEAGNIHGYLKIFRDMTRAKRAEEALKDADRRKDEFLALLAHELRNPLAAISNAAAVLLMPGGDKALEWAQEVITRQSKSLSRLLDDLLDVSRVTKGKIRLRNERIDLAPIINKAIELVRPLIEEKKHSLTLTIAPGEIAVMGDALRIEQIFVNLLTNAAKYTDAGGSITITAHQSEEAIIIVRDNGVGIADDMLTYIFEPFVQADRSLDRSQGGLGIGLTLARSLVELHGGTITAKSDGPGKGSEFSIRLPLADANGNKTVSSSLPSRSPSTAKLRALVVDDNLDTAIGLAKILEIWGYEVRTSHDGISAIELARTQAPDAVLMDIGLPGLNGYEVAKRLRQDPNCGASMLIAISGYGQEEDRRLSKEAGFDHHFVKPVDYSSLKIVLSSLVQKASPSPDHKAP